MIEIIKELSIEVTKPNIFQAIVAKQYDMNTRFLKVTLMDCGNRIDVPLTETTKVVINAERKDGQSKGFDGVINEDGTVTVPLHSWMLELDGTVICDISVMDVAEDDNKKLTTTSFTLLVEKAAYGGDDITSDPQYDVLVQLLESCAEANTVAEEALKKSNEANAKYKACVEATNEANEATENANAATEELGAIKEELAEGGYITGIKESNHGNILGFWVGTQEEYKALETPPQNSYVVITDDTTLEDINKVLDKLSVDYIVETGTRDNWLYEKWNSGKCKLYPEAGCNYLNNNALFGRANFPFEFSKIYSCNCTINYIDPNALDWSRSWNILAPYTLTSVDMYVSSSMGFTEQNALPISIEVVGILKQEV